MPPLNPKFVQSYLYKKSARLNKQRTSLYDLLATKYAAGLKPSLHVNIHTGKRTFVWKANKHKAEQRKLRASHKRAINSAEARRARAIKLPPPPPARRKSTKRRLSKPASASTASTASAPNTRRRRSYKKQH